MEQYQETVKKLSSLVDLSEDAFFEFDGEGTYLDIWVRDEALLARPRNELLHKTVYDVLDQEKASQFVKLFNQVIDSQESVDLEYSIETPVDTRWFLGRAKPSVLGDKKTVLFCARDITEKKHKDLALNMVLESVGVGVWSLDKDGTHIVWDQGMYDIYGLQKSDFNVSMDSWLDLIHPADRETIGTELKESLNTGVPFDSIFRVISKSGETQYISAKGNVSRDENEKPFRITGINLDITEKMRVADNLRHANKLQSIGELAAGIGHEINNPLAIATGTLTLLTREIESQGLNSEKINEYFLTCSDALIRITNIVQGLRSFTRVDSEQKEVFDVGQAVHRNLRLVEKTYKNEGIQLIKRLPEEKLCSLGGSGRFQQAVLNLMTNARDATKGQLDRKIEVELTTVPEKILLKISDNGVGIDFKFREKIFDSFFTTKNVGEGTGLGLSLANSIVQEMGGAITCLSEVGQGTCFTIEIPRVSEKGIESRLEDPSESLQKETQGKVLVLDDEPAIRMIIKETLESHFFEVDEALTGDEAIEMVRKGSYDFVISDLIMPGMNGIEVAKNIKELQLDKIPAFIAITGGIEMKPEVAGLKMESFVDEVLHKPFREEDLINVLSRVRPTV